MQNHVLHLYGNARKRIVMINETHERNIFEIENCRAENSIKDWVDCLSPKQASVCGFSVNFGTGYSCEHPRRFKFVDITEKLRSKLGSPPNIL
jgi:hypothetical protein